MKSANRHLRAELIQSLQQHLDGLNRRHTKELRITVVGAVKKLTQSRAKLLRHELKTRQRKHQQLLQATKNSVRELIRRLHQALGHAPLSVARG